MYLVKINENFYEVEPNDEIAKTYIIKEPYKSDTRIPNKWLMINIALEKIKKGDYYSLVCRGARIFDYCTMKNFVTDLYYSANKKEFAYVFEPSDRVVTRNEMIFFYNVEINGVRYYRPCEDEIPCI